MLVRIGYRPHIVNKTNCYHELLTLNTVFKHYFEIGSSAILLHLTVTGTVLALSRLANVDDIDE